MGQIMSRSSQPRWPDHLDLRDENETKNPRRELDNLESMAKHTIEFCKMDSPEQAVRIAKLLNSQGGLFFSAKENTLCVDYNRKHLPNETHYLIGATIRGIKLAWSEAERTAPYAQTNH
jgi:hypothetical protein